MSVPQIEIIGRPGEPSPAPFHRARLANGLRVLVRPSRAVPIVAIDCWLAVIPLIESVIWNPPVLVGGVIVVVGGVTVSE